MDKKEIKSMEEFIKKLPKEEIDDINQKEIERTKLQYKEFSKEFSKGNCIFCKSKINSFNEEEPCMHWLLLPKGFKKRRHIKLIFKNFNYMRVDAYLRWAASQEASFVNINDFVEEKRGSMIFEYTIRYKNIEWSFSCSQGDFIGHKSSRFRKGPHYHLQIRKNGLQFLNFGNLHISLTDYDKYFIQVKEGEIEGIEFVGSFGTSMKDLFENINPEELLKNAQVTDDYNNAPIHTSYMIQAEPGNTISGDDLADIIEESKKTGKPLWNLLPKLKNVGKKMAIVSPGEGLVEISRRKGGRQKKNDSR